MSIVLRTGITDTPEVVPYVSPSLNCGVDNFYFYTDANSTIG